MTNTRQVATFALAFVRFGAPTNSKAGLRTKHCRIKISASTLPNRSPPQHIKRIPIGGDRPVDLGACVFVHLLYVDWHHVGGLARRDRQHPQERLHPGRGQLVDALAAGKRDQLQVCPDRAARAVHQRRDDLSRRVLVKYSTPTIIQYRRAFKVSNTNCLECSFSLVPVPGCEVREDVVV